jgi:hypothetical protein
MSLDTVASRLLASFRKDYRIIGGAFRLAVYGKILQGEAELLEQHDRERCVGLGSFYRLADGISKETGIPIENVDEMIQELAKAANPKDPESLKGQLQAFGILNSDPQRLIGFLAHQAQLDDQKKVLATTLLLGRGEYLNEAGEWVRFTPGDWSEADTAKLPADYVIELHAFLLEEKAAMTAGGKPPAPKPAPKPQPQKQRSAGKSTASA